MRKFAFRIVSLLVVVAVVGYVGFEVYYSFFKGYKTEIAMEYTVKEELSVTGVFVRDETVIPNNGNGVVNYTVADAQKVAAGDTVAQIVGSVDDLINIQKKEELQAEIDALTQCQRTDANVVRPDLINASLYNTIANLNRGLENGDLPDTAGYKSDIQNQLNKKQIGLGIVTDFSKRIGELQAELKALPNVNTSGVRPVTSPVVGNFISATDGYENTLKTADIPKMTVADVNGLVRGKTDYAGNDVGKVITNFSWYFVSVVSDAEAQITAASPSPRVNFNIQSYSSVPVTVVSVQSDGSGQSVLVLRGEYMSPDLSKLRVQKAVMTQNVVTGLRVSKKAVRFEGTIPGVYVVEDKAMKFHPIDIIYDDPGFVICSEQSTTVANSVKMYDEIVTDGTNLYGGKPVR